MQDLSFVRSLIEVYEDPGIEVSYTDADDGQKTAVLNDANAWDTALTDGSTLTIGVTKDSVPISITQTNSSTWVDLSQVGEYTITYQFTDDKGNTNGITRTVTVAEGITPIIELELSDSQGSTLSPYYIPVGGTYTEPGYRVIDEDSPIVINENIQIAGITAIDTSIAGTYQVTYDYTDTSGLTATPAVRDIEVFVNSGPVINMIGDSAYELSIGDDFIDPGATANDALGFDISGRIITQSDLNTTVPGTYSITYSVIDDFGETSSVTRNIVVQDYPNLDDVEMELEDRDIGSDVFQFGEGREAVYLKDFSISNFTEITDVNSVLQNVYNIIFQSPRDRFFNPVFGCRIRNTVFDLMDDSTEEQVLSILKEDIERFEPRVTVLTSQSFVDINPSSNSYIVALKIRVPYSDQLETVGFTVNQ